MKKILIIISVILSVYCVNAADNISEVDYKDYWEYADKNPRFDVLQKTMNKVIIECEKMDKSTNLEEREKYAYWAADILRHLLAINNLNKEQVDYCRQKLNILLNKMDLFSHNTNASFLGAMSTLATAYRPKDIPEADFAELRKNNVERFCVEINRIEKEMNPTWNPDKNLPSLNVHLPEGVPGVAGMAPSSIKDPVKRKEYEKAIEENNQKAKVYNVQNDLRSAKKEIYMRFTLYAPLAYQRKPYNTDELKELLNKYNIDKATQEQILKKVEATVPKSDK